MGITKELREGDAATTIDELYRMSDERQMYYATTGSCIDTSTTYVHIPDNDNVLEVVCDGEQVTISWKNLFKLLKWAYGQWGGRE